MGARRAARLSLVVVWADVCAGGCAAVAGRVMSCSDVLVDRVCAAFRLGCEVVPYAPCCMSLAVAVGLLLCTVAVVRSCSHCDAVCLLSVLATGGEWASRRPPGRPGCPRRTWSCCSFDEGARLPGWLCVASGSPASGSRHNAHRPWRVGRDGEYQRGTSNWR